MAEKSLVPDKATSSVDIETEGRIQRAMASLTEGPTSILIARRLFTILHADRILVMHTFLVMHKDQVREFGAHRELMAIRGIYWRLHRLQFPRNEVAEEAAV